MTVYIYDYANDAIEIELPDKEIVEIFVSIITGDEIVTFTFEDGTEDSFDSCPNGRIRQFNDGFYFVEGKENIKRWLDFEPSPLRTASYKRKQIFDGGTLW